MVKHIVIWKLKEAAAGSDKASNAQLAKEKLEALNGKIPGLLKLEVGIDFMHGETSGDVVLYSELESKEALNVYIEHPLHKEAGKFIREVVSARTSADFVC
ncbi:MAG: Dabb family protein [Prevotellaceae bacterium]|nr:Dabb family protein [Prevotellaceae bacterium]